MKTLTIPPHVLTLVRDYGHNKAVSWLEGSEELAKPDDDLTSFLSRHDVEFDHLTESDRDALRDLYLETIKLTFAQRLTSSPVTVEVPLGKPGGPSAASGSLDRDGTDAPPLGRVANFPQTSSLRFQDDVPRTAWMDGDKENMALTCSPEGFLLNKERIPSLIAHLQAWMLTGSFSLTPPVSTQSPAGASLPAFPRKSEAPIHEAFESLKPLDRYIQALEPGPHRETMIRGWNLLVYGVESLTSTVYTQIDSGASLAADRHSVPPSPKKPVVQPTGSDSAGLLEECRRVLEIILPMAQRGRAMSGPFSETDQIMDEAANLYNKLNA